MKKYLLSLSMLTLCSGLNAFELEMEMGSGAFYSAAPGKLIYQVTFLEGSSSTFDYTSQSLPYLWAEFKLKNPYVPQFRFEYLHVDVQGDSDIFLKDNLEICKLIDDINPAIPTIPGISKFSCNRTDGHQFIQDSTLKVNFYDTFLFYSFFEDSIWPSIDTGIGYKSFHYSYDLILASTSDSELNLNDQGSASIPMIYFSSRYQVPVLDMGLEFNAKAYIFGDSQIYDYNIKTDLLVAFSKEISGGVEVGYRQSYFNIKGNDVEEVSGNINFSGMFFGVVGHFH